MKKKLTHIGPYWRTSYGKRRKIVGHYRGHGLSKSLPGSDGKHYRTGGKTHRYSPSRDRARKATHTRNYGKAHWRGDRKGSKI